MTGGTSCQPARRSPSLQTLCCRFSGQALWLIDAGQLLGVHAKTIHFYKKNGTITNYKEEPYLLIHRDEPGNAPVTGFFAAQYGGDCWARVEISYSPKFTSYETEEIISQLFLFN